MSLSSCMQGHHGRPGVIPAGPSWPPWLLLLQRHHDRRTAMGITKLQHGRKPANCHKESWSRNRALTAGGSYL